MSLIDETKKAMGYQDAAGTCNDCKYCDEKEGATNES